MKKVCIQTGHINIENITSEGLRSWRSPSVLKRSTGASGERKWHWEEWMPRLRDRLIQAGVQVYIIDAIYNKDTYSQEYDLWVSGHYDGGGTGERCMISAPNRDTVPAYLNDAAQREAERFCAIWKKTYPGIVGVPNRDDLITIGMKDYYAYDYVGYDTPSVIIEHFNHSSIKGSELKADPDKVVDGDFQAIVEFLNIQGDIPGGDCEQELAECRTNLQGSQNLLAKKSEEMADVLREHNKTLDKLTKQQQDNADLGKQLLEERDKVATFAREAKEMAREAENLNEALDKANNNLSNAEEEIKRLKRELKGSATSAIRNSSWLFILKTKLGRNGGDSK